VYLPSPSVSSNPLIFFMRYTRYIRYISYDNTHRPSRFQHQHGLESHGEGSLAVLLYLPSGTVRRQDYEGAILRQGNRVRSQFFHR
jgi:hypothetical protein